MPSPFMCHWCDKPTMNEAGICIECEQRYEEGNKGIAETVRELESRVRWLEKGLKEILDCCDLKDTYGWGDRQICAKMEDTAKSTLDGEPTTADEHNFSETRNAQNFSASPENTVRISDINKEIAKEWNRDREKTINKEKTK